MVRIERLIILLLGLALLHAWWKLYRGKVKRWWKRTKDHLPRHWRPKSPDDCPHCLAEKQDVEPSEMPELPVPYPEQKSSRGRKKQLDTIGWACPNEACVYFGETNAERHALMGHRKIGQDKTIQRLMCAACQTTFVGNYPHFRRGLPLSRALRIYIIRISG